MIDHDPYPFVRKSDGSRISQSGVELFELNTTQYERVPRDKYLTNDPKPWVAWGVRYAEFEGSMYFDPRPDFAVTQCESSDPTKEEV